MQTLKQRLFEIDVIGMRAFAIEGMLGSTSSVWALVGDDARSTDEIYEQLKAVAEEALLVDDGADEDTEDWRSWRVGSLLQAIQYYTEQGAIRAK